MPLDRHDEARQHGEHHARDDGAARAGIEEPALVALLHLDEIGGERGQHEDRLEALAENDEQGIDEEARAVGGGTGVTAERVEHSRERRGLRAHLARRLPALHRRDQREPAHLEIGVARRVAALQVGVRRGGLEAEEGVADREMRVGCRIALAGVANGRGEIGGGRRGRDRGSRRDE